MSLLAFRNPPSASALPLALVLSAGCVAGTGDDPPALTAVEQAATIVKRVPIRIVEAHDCEVGNAVDCGAYVTGDQYMTVLAAVNTAFAPAGIEFWIKSVERRKLPSFVAMALPDDEEEDEEEEEDVPDVSWSSIRDEVTPVFGTPRFAFTGGTMRNPRSWLSSLTTLWGDPDEIMLWVHQHPGGDSAGIDPESGRFIRLDDDAFVGGGGIARFVLTHELGHFFGLRHAWGPVYGHDPVSGDPWTARDLWDLHVCGPTGSVFEQPVDLLTCQPGGMWAAEAAGERRMGADTFTPSYRLDGVTYQPGDPGTQGLMFELGTPHNPPQSSAFALNAMTYPRKWGLDSRIPVRFSASQIAVMKRYRDHDIELEPGTNTRNRAGLIDQTGMVDDADHGLRPLLGTLTDDMVWLGNGLGADDLTFASRTVPVSGTSYRLLATDLDENTFTDLVWYKPADGVAHLWFSNGDGTFTHRDFVSVPANAVPFTGDFDGDGRGEIFLRLPNATDRILEWTGSSFASRTVAIDMASAHQPIVGNFDNLAGDDILWYAGVAGTVIAWWSQGASFAAPVTLTTSAAGTYRPVAGNFDGDLFDDVLFYAPGDAVSDRVWYGASTRSFDKHSVSISGTYTPVVADLDGSGRDDVLWNGAGATDPVWRGMATRGTFDQTPRVTITGEFQIVAGRFDSPGSGELDAADLFLYRN